MSSAKNAHTQNVVNKEEIFHAIQTNNLELLKKLVNAENVNIKDRSGYTLLHIATNNEKSDIAKWLVSIGADVNIHCNSHTVLSTALTKANYDLFDFYLENKAECIGRNQLNVLHEAANKNRFDIVERLIEKGADPNLFNNLHITPLTIAINHKNKQIILFLLENGACANLPDKKGNTALHLACSMCEPDILNCLLENTECDLKLKNLNEETPLDLLWINLIKENNKFNLEESLLHKLVELGACFSMPWNYNLNLTNYATFLKLISILCKYKLKDLFLNDKPFFSDLILNSFWRNSVIIAIKSAVLDAKLSASTKSELLASIEKILLANEFNLKQNDLLATLYGICDEEPESEQQDVFKYVKKFYSKPFSLKNLCRNEIRKNVINLSQDTLLKLKLNDSKLINFLNFDATNPTS